MGVAHDPVDSLEVGQVPLRHVHQLGGVYLVGEVGRAVLQRGRVFILVAVFLGMGTEESLGRPVPQVQSARPGSRLPPPPSAVRKALGPDQLLPIPLLQPIGSPLSTLPTAPSPARASASLLSPQAPSPFLNSYSSHPWALAFYQRLPSTTIYVFTPFPEFHLLLPLSFRSSGP